MKRIAVIAGVLLCAPHWALAGPVSHASVQVFIERGEAKAIRESGAKWHRRPGDLARRSGSFERIVPFLECSGTGNYLYAASGLAPGDFHIRARLSLERLDGTAAAFVLGGDRFGFDGGDPPGGGDGSRLFVEGATFGKTRFLEPAATYIAPGRPFDFEAVFIELRREEGRITFRIDGKDVFTAPFRRAAVGEFGLRPWRGTMRVYDFSATGRFTKPLPTTDVFVSGKDGYHTYRIPSLFVTAKGTVLAFAEGRKGGRGDAGDIDMVVKRSTDGGATWSRQQVVWDDGGNTCGNACPVLDEDSGRIWLALTWNHGKDREHDIIAGRSRHPRKPFMCFSDDDGLTWSEPRDLSATARGEDWGWYATGPGVGIQLRVGEHAGRLVVPANHSSRSYEDHHYGSHVVYSDDRGETWRRSDPIRPACNESQAFERVDGSLVMNMRSYNKKGRRAVATSADGGETWSEVRHDDALIESVCQASILRLHPSTETADKTVLFSNPATTRGRTKMTVRASFDDGRTWPVARLVHAGSAAYSCLAIMPDGGPGTVRSARRNLTIVRGGDIGLLYERDGYGKITFVRFGLDWLLDRNGEHEEGGAAVEEDASRPPSARNGTLHSKDPDLRARRGFGIPLVDLAGETHRQVVVDREDGQYLGHPTTVLLEDGRTMICVYPKGHGRGAIVMKRSTDGGRNWSERLPVPGSWSTSKEVPTIYRMVDAAGVRRLIMFSGLYPIRIAVSEDDGATWSELAPIGDYGGIVAMSDVIALATPGRYLAMFHDDGRFFRGEGKRRGRMELYTVFSADGGLTWGEPRTVVSRSDVALCEAGLVRSPDGGEIAALLRENSRRRNSFVIFSHDEGETWSEPRELPGALTGDRHQAVYAPDGRLFVSFRDRSPKGTRTPTDGDWVAWVGTFDDIVAGREGQYRVRLMDNRHKWDCAYPALELLPDGTIVATTYGHWTAGAKPYIVSVRFRIEEIDAAAARGGATP